MCVHVCAYVCVCMCACMCVYMFVHVYVHVYMCVHVFVHVYMCMCMCTCVCMCVYVYVQVYMCVHVCVHVYVHVYMCVHVCVHVCVRVCVHVCVYLCQSCVCVLVDLCAPLLCVQTEEVGEVLITNLDLTQPSNTRSSSPWVMSSDTSSSAQHTRRLPATLQRLQERQRGLPPPHPSANKPGAQMTSSIQLQAMPNIAKQTVLKTSLPTTIQPSTTLPTTAQPSTRRRREKAITEPPPPLPTPFEVIKQLIVLRALQLTHHRRLMQLRNGVMS